MGLTEFPDDCLPPEGQFDSRESLLASINAWAAPRGYAFTTGKSTRDPRSGRRTITFACDRGGRPGAHTSKDQKPAERQRSTSSRITGCQFSINAKESLDKSYWYIKHRPGEEKSVHNHEPSLHITAHPAHRALSSTDQSVIGNLASAGIAPKDIRTYMRQSSQTAQGATQQDIYNCIAQRRRELLAGQSTMHALANELDKEGFQTRIQLDHDGRVTAVLFAHPTSLGYLNAYPELLLLDCTYKTNKYKMPLLDMIGADACQRSFCIAFAFLSGEDEDDYIWALDQLQSIYELYDIRQPSVILTDRCLACMNAISRCFPAS